MRWVLLLLALTIVSGCTMASRYEACLQDEVCVAEVNKARHATYEVVKTTADAVPFPDVPQVIAMITSNIVAFGVGVWKGKKKKGC